MSTTQITDLIIQLCPAIVTIITLIGAVARIIKSFTGLRKHVSESDVAHTKEVEALNVKMSKDIADLNDKMQAILNENYELKKALNETLTKIDHIDRRSQK